METVAIDEQAAIGCLVAAFPETRAGHEDLRDTWTLAPNDLGIYIVFGDLFSVDIFWRLMTQDHLDADWLSRFFAVLEELCRDGNKLVREFVGDEVCEVLNAHPEWWRERVDAFIGPEMVIECQES
jgi:hypothetical protein